MMYIRIIESNIKLFAATAARACLRFPRSDEGGGEGDCDRTKQRPWTDGQDNR